MLDIVDLKELDIGHIIEIEENKMLKMKIKNQNPMMKMNMPI